MHKRKIIGLTMLVVLALPAPGLAQKDPNFVSAAKDKKAAEKVEWAASAQAGVNYSTGNTEQTVLQGGVKASRKQGYNKLQMEANGKFTRANAPIFVLVDTDGDMVPDTEFYQDQDGDGEIDRFSETTAQAWDVKARYDRFLTEHNSVYISALANGDKPAGKTFVGGLQAGYSRQLYKNEKHEVTGEVGYDFSYEKQEPEDLQIHSGRLFAGYVGKLTEATSVTGSIEVLMNMNRLNEQIGAFEDTRALGKAELVTKLFEDLSFGFSVTAKYDNAPSPLPKQLRVGDEVRTVLAEKLDTTTQASLIFNFL